MIASVALLSAAEVFLWPCPIQLPWHGIETMDVWVISDHEGLISRVRQSLERTESGCAYVRVSNVAACLNSGVSSAAVDDVVFYVVATLTSHDFDFLRQLRASTRASLAVIAPTTDNSIVLRAIRAGAEDFLDADGELNEEITTFLSRARADQSQQAARGQLLCVLSSYLPTDASILSANLAAALAKQFGTCALLDFHRRGGDLALLLKLSPRHTLVDLMSQHHGVDQVMFQQALAAHSSGVHLLASPPTWLDQPALPANSYEEVLHLALSSHPVVVVSSEDATYLSQLLTFANCDRIALAMRLDLLSLHKAQQHLQYLRQRNAPVEKIEVVAMGTGHPGELPIAAVAKTLGISKIHLVPDDALAMTIAINLGNPLVVETPTSPATIAIKRLAAAMSGTTCNDAELEPVDYVAIARDAVINTYKELMSRAVQLKASFRS